MPRTILLRISILICITFSPTKIFCQDVHEDLQPLYAELDSLFADESIPGDLFALADSLLALEKAKVSALSLRVGYVSQIVSAGRTLGFEQYGISPAATYFHHSGITAGATGYWSSEYDPAYYLTNLNVGYTRTFKRFNAQINHDFYIYNDSLKDDHPFSNSALASVTYQRKRYDIGVDYGFLYGNSQAHRLTARANLNLKLRLKGFVNAITFMPGASFQWGNADVYFWRQPRTAAYDLYNIVRANDYPRLTRREYIRLTSLLENDRDFAAALFLRERNYTVDEIRDLFAQYEEGAVLSEDTFGFMNFSISLPVIIRSGNFSLLLNYTFNQPQALPGETYTYDSNNYFSASVSYLMSWMKK